MSKRERESEHTRAQMGEGQRERERDREREKIPSRLHTPSTEPEAGLDPMNREIMTCAETESWTLN